MNVYLYLKFVNVFSDGLSVCFSNKVVDSHSLSMYCYLNKDLRNVLRLDLHIKCDLTNNSIQSAIYLFHYIYCVNLIKCFGTKSLHYLQTLNE